MSTNQSSWLNSGQILQLYIWKFCRWGADVPPGETYLAAKSKEKQLYLRAKISDLYTIYLHWFILEFQFILFHISSYVMTKVLRKQLVRN